MTLSFRTLSRIRGGLTQKLSTAEFEVRAFPSPREDFWGGANEGEKEFTKVYVTFPFPREELGGSNAITKLMRITGDLVSVPSRGFWGF